MSIDPSCNQQISNCKGNELSVKSFCFPISNGKNPDCQELISNEFSLASPQVISRINNVSLYECLDECKRNQNCKAAVFNYGSHGSGKSAFANGSCVLSSNGDITQDYVSTSLDPAFSCGNTYVKSQDAASKDCMTITSKTGNSVSIDTSQQYSPGQVMKIAADYWGPECRKGAIENTLTDPDLLAAMKTWCDSHENVDVCVDFKNKYSNLYPVSLPIGVLVSAGCLLASIFLTIVLKVKNKTVIPGLFLSVASAVSLGVFLYQTYKPKKQQVTISDNTNFFSNANRDPCNVPNCDTSCQEAMGTCECVLQHKYFCNLDTQKCEPNKDAICDITTCESQCATTFPGINNPYVNLSSYCNISTNALFLNYYYTIPGGVDTILATNNPHVSKLTIIKHPTYKYTSNYLKYGDPFYIQVKEMDYKFLGIGDVLDYDSIVTLRGELPDAIPLALFPVDSSLYEKFVKATDKTYIKLYNTGTYLTSQTFQDPAIPGTVDYLKGVQMAPIKGNSSFLFTIQPDRYKSISCAREPSPPEA